MKQLTDFFEDKEVNSVLDVGTGPGNFIGVLEKVFPAAEMYGVDPDEEALKEATQKYPSAHFSVMKGETLAFENEHFDAASISMALHHLSDVQATLKEMQRVVKPGGWIIINELFSDHLNPAQEVHKAMHHFRSKIDRLNGICHNNSFQKNEILEMAETSGLKICLHFDYNSKAATTDATDIEERKKKLHEAVETIKDKPQYLTFKEEIPEIEAALGQFGFEMATCLVVVGEVQ
ncbi:class I SAM-dependent methyltransferase [Maribellus sp. YY47]|uniref:class I SAM-dependent methyltransferase n=1 Tax=Maribellus sp. YY47 TaxID=2929486 RepID=UPI002000D184|nr:class I SAM-dependent methyltransferase [Maribellus sp. YY47]MCK3682505.1 methyltransferase domain-containing protein [Maribellus sp. YY47]